MATYYASVPADDVVGMALERTRMLYDKVKLAEDRFVGDGAAAVPKRMENDLQWLKMIRLVCVVDSVCVLVGRWQQQRRAAGGVDIVR